jgi:hypothetical protein
MDPTSGHAADRVAIMLRERAEGTPSMPGRDIPALEIEAQNKRGSREDER